MHNFRRYISDQNFKNVRVALSSEVRTIVILELVVAANSNNNCSGPWNGVVHTKFNDNIDAKVIYWGWGGGAYSGTCT
jgi:hypothetical protein